MKGRVVRRRRKNSKFEHCKEELRREEGVVGEAADLAMLALKQKKVWALKPFAHDFCKTSYDQYVHEAESRYSSEYGSNIRKLKTQHSDFQSAKRKRCLTRTDLKSSLDKIINGDLITVTDFDASMNVGSNKKTEQEIVVDQHLAEINKAKQDQKALKDRITKKFAQRYPERVKTALSSGNLIDYFSKTKKQPQFRCFRPQTPKPSTSKRMTYFYSRSRRKCMMERYFPMERPPEEKEVHASVSFIEYLWDDRVRKSLRKSSEAKKQRCNNLLKSKDNILRIEKQGTKRQQVLKECLDQIIMENRLR